MAQIPVVDLERFEARIEDFNWVEGTGDLGRGTEVARLRGETITTEDGVASYIMAGGWPHYDLVDGKLQVDCPWKDLHSSENGPSETVWFVAGSGGYSQGHFKCMHESCREHWPKFEEAIGYRNTLFKPVVDVERLTFTRDKNGQIAATINSVVRAVKHAHTCGVELRYDLFTDDLLVRVTGGMQWRPFTDADAVALRMVLEAFGFKPVGVELMRSALIKVSADNTFDSAKDRLGALPAWDGVHRVETVLLDRFGVPDTPYARSMGRYMFTGLVGRIMEPGCLAPMTPVFVGPQGIGKSRGIAALALEPEWSVKISFEEKDDDRARKLRGASVVELDELHGLNSREAGAIKSWMSRQVEHWTPKYRERTTSFSRRCLMFGSTNDQHFLTDPTGERRWLPILVGLIDVEGLVQDRDQLWAEALVMWRAEGIAWAEVEELARAEHDAFTWQDGWHDDVVQWLESEIDLTGDTPLSKGYVTVGEVVTGALGLTTPQRTKVVEMRVGAILRVVGLTRKLLWRDGKPHRGWVKEVL